MRLLSKFYIETLENSYNLFDSSNRLIGEYSYDNYIKSRFKYKCSSDK